MKLYHISQLVYIPHSVDYTFEADDEKLAEILKSVGITLDQAQIIDLENGGVIDLESPVESEPVSSISLDWFQEDPYVENLFDTWKTDGQFFIEKVGNEDANV